MSKKRAFTLVVKLMILILVGLMAGVLAPGTLHSETNKEKLCNSNVGMLIHSMFVQASGNKEKFPADQNEFNGEILNNKLCFPQGAPVCPYGATYRYDATHTTVTFHSH